jgi:hypothetical protein
VGKAEVEEEATMTSFDDLLKKKTNAKPEQKKTVGYISDLDRRIAKLKAEKENAKQKTMVTMQTQQIGNEDEEYQKPDVDQKIINNMYNKVKGRFSLGRREKNMILAKETEGTKNKQWFVFIFAIIGMFFLMSLQYTIHDDWIILVVLLLGSMMFLPVGMLVGWALLDPYVRCKVLRKASKKNFGIINFVVKGQKIISKVKNFDTALIWKKNETWVITKEHMYQLSKDGDTIVEKSKIDPESVVTLIDTVPVLFVDLDSMQPLSLSRDRREGINPLELGSTLKAWVDNQLAKAMFLKKTMDIYLLIILIVSIVSAFLSYLNMSHMEELSGQLKTIQGQLAELLRLSQINHP